MKRMIGGINAAARISAPTTNARIDRPIIAPR
jgi:hypothetical protein